MWKDNSEAGTPVISQLVLKKMRFTISVNRKSSHVMRCFDSGGKNRVRIVLALIGPTFIALVGMLDRI